MATASGIDVRKMSPTAVQALVDMIDAFARFAHAATVDTADPGGLLPLADAARVAGTSMRVLRDAIRRGTCIRAPTGPRRHAGGLDSMDRESSRSARERPD
jgi:hypothetical protein